MLFRATDSTPVILVANLLVYSTVALAGTFSLGPTQLWRRAIPWLAVPVGVLICLASIPTLDPLWPVGMTKMTKKEAQLQVELPLGTDLGQARQVLHSQNIQFTERVEDSNVTVFERQDGIITASPGDRAVFGEVSTDAFSFPCGYKIDVVLLFGPEGKIKQRYIHHTPICL